MPAPPDNLLPASLDPALRRRRGVWYTPRALVEAQVRLLDECLRRDLQLSGGLGHPDVGVLDPALGTGAYLLACVAHALRDGVPTASDRHDAAAKLAPRLFGVEIMPGPLAMAQQQLRAALGPRAGLPRLALGDALRRDVIAGVLAAAPPVLAVLGNPPWRRTSHDGAAPVAESSRMAADLEAFLAPARAAGLGRHLKSAHDDYVRFWRLAVHEAAERRTGPAVVCLVTPAAFLRGAAFAGMRAHLRAEFDDLWLLELGGDQLGARKSANVFAVRVPAVVTLAVRRGPRAAGRSARVWHAELPGDAATKLTRLADLRSRDQIAWQPCPDGPLAPWLPATTGGFATWPRLVDLFPWQQSGVKPGRTWVVAPHADLLAARWQALGATTGPGRTEAFKPSPTGRKPGDRPPPLGQDPRADVAVADLAADAPPPPVVPYAWRAFDRRWLLADARLLDRPGPALWQAHGPHQLYLTGLLTKVPGTGPALVATALLPDLDHFCGRGAKDVVPLWRDRAGHEPNVTAGLLDALASGLQQPVTPEDLAACVYAALAAPSYTSRFAVELGGAGGPAVPLSRDPALFRRGVALGAELLRWHTCGRWGCQPGDGFALQGQARVVVPLQPTAWAPARYEPEGQALHVAGGQIAPVTPETWAFSVSGLRVVRSWLAARRPEPAGKVSSPLDAVRATAWHPDWTHELLELLWLLERTLTLGPTLDAWQAEVLAGPLWQAGQLPQPRPVERLAPTVPRR